VAKPAVAGGTVIEAPMPGMIIRYEVKEGDTVSEGDVVLILEAMKMENSITAPTTGSVLSISFKNGDSVQKGDTLAVIG
jgi:pyruvate carboxylase subunit B